MSEQLEQLFREEPKMFKILNIFSCDRVDYRKATYYLRIIEKCIPKEKENVIFDLLNSMRLFDRKIVYECEEENYDASILEKNVIIVVKKLVVMNITICINQIFLFNYQSTTKINYRNILIRILKL